MKKASALFVMPTGMQQEFGRLAADQQVEWLGVETCDQARAELARNPDIGAVVSNDSLPDGSWYCILHELVRKGLDADLLVVLPAGCNSTIVMSHGIYGVLSYPVEAAAGLTIADAARQAETALAR